jgi:hypothetical protein
MITARVAGLRSEIWTQELPDTNEECLPLDHWGGVWVGTVGARGHLPEPYWLPVCLPVQQLLNRRCKNNSVSIVTKTQRSDRHHSRWVAENRTSKNWSSVGAFQCCQWPPSWILLWKHRLPSRWLSTSYHQHFSEVVLKTSEGGQR